MSSNKTRPSLNWGNDHDFFTNQIDNGRFADYGARSPHLERINYIAMNVSFIIISRHRFSKLRRSLKFEISCVVVRWKRRSVILSKILRAQSPCFDFMTQYFQTRSSQELREIKSDCNAQTSGFVESSNFDWRSLLFHWARIECFHWNLGLMNERGIFSRRFSFYFITCFAFQLDVKRGGRCCWAWREQASRAVCVQVDWSWPITPKVCLWKRWPFLLNALFFVNIVTLIRKRFFFCGR